MPQPSHDSIPDYIDPQELKDTFDKAEEAYQRRYFTDEELIEMKEQYFELSSQIARREELAAILKTCALEFLEPAEKLRTLANGDSLQHDYGYQPIKGLKSTASDLQSLINTGFEMVPGTVYGVKFFDVHVMAFYAEDGQFVKDRPLTDKELQLSIK